MQLRIMCKTGRRALIYELLEEQAGIGPDAVTRIEGAAQDETLSFAIHEQTAAVWALLWCQQATACGLINGWQTHYGPLHELKEL